MNSASPVPPGLWPILAVMIGALVVSSLVRLLMARQADPETRATRLSSLRAWWILTLAFSVALLLGPGGVCAFFAIATALAMREHLELIGASVGLAELVVFGALILAAYALLMVGQTNLFLAGIPVVALVFALIAALGRGGTENLVRRTAVLYWGAIFLVWGTGHVVTYYHLVPPDAGAAGPAGWIVLVVFLTEMNDIAQAVTGRFFARRRAHYVTPHVSPGKTWEGLLGGAVFTVVLAMVLTSWLTELDELGPALGPWTVDSHLLLAATLGLLVSVGGFLGDINMSALKRRAGVKDSGRLLGGMGGLIDRIDSLTVTAPVTAWFLVWMRA